jgi:origin recognition complex subunit 3
LKLPETHGRFKCASFLRILRANKISLVEMSLSTKEDAQTARKLLESDQDLYDAIIREVGASQAALDSMTRAVELLHSIRSSLPMLSDISVSKLYIQALAGDLLDGTALREALLTLKKSPSDQLEAILDSTRPFISEEAVQELNKLEEDLSTLLSEAGTGLKSQYDVKNQTMRTTVVAQRVELSKQKAQVTEHDASYSELLDSVHEWLKEYFEQHLASAEDVLFWEMFVYKGKRPDRLAFMPTHRQAIEKALSNPHAYLNCDCCKPDAHDNGEVCKPDAAQSLTNAGHTRCDTAAYSSVISTLLGIRLCHQCRRSMDGFQRCA